MPKRKAMGKDPLEWIGKEDPFQFHSNFEKPSSLNQEPFGEKHSYPELEKPLIVDESRIEVPTSGFDEP